MVGDKIPRNPTKGESRDDYVSMCIKYLIDHGEYPNTAQGRKDAAGQCYSRYDEAKKKKNKSSNTVELDGMSAFQYDSANIDGKLQKAIMSKLSIGVEEETDEYVKVRLIAAVGDIFFQNVFMPEEAVRASAELWDNTYHDISHLATKYPAGFSFTENLDYLLGYNTDINYDSETKALSMSAYIRKDAPKYGAWRNYIEICKASGKIPNVSIFAMAKYQAVRASELPNGVAVPMGAEVNGYVISIKTLEPIAVTTCLLGKCDDKKGCGIDIQGNQDIEGIHGVDIDKTDEITTDDDDSEKKNYYLKRIKQLKKGD